MYLNKKVHLKPVEFTNVILAGGTFKVEKFDELKVNLNRYNGTLSIYTVRENKSCLIFSCELLENDIQKLLNTQFFSRSTELEKDFFIKEIELDFNIDAINFSLVSGIDRFLIVKGEKYSVNIDNLLFNLKEMIK
jgi:hypothetical protein